MKLLRFLLVVAASFGLVSCFEMKSSVVVNKDGSATVEETVLIGAQLAAMMAQGGGQGGPGEQLKGLMLDKESAEKRAKDLGEGVTVKSIEEVKSADGKTGNKVTFAVADIRKLKYKPNTPDDKPEGEKKEGDEMTFTLDGSTLTITNPESDKKKGDGAEKPKKSPEELAAMKGQMAMMKPMLAGMRMTVEVKAAGGIATSDASHQTADTVTYIDIQFDKLMENFDAFAEMMEGMDGMSMSDAAKKFEKVDGMKIEGKKVVKIDLK